MKGSLLVSAALLLLLAGCTSGQAQLEQAPLTIEPNASLTGYNAIAVAPASNETGQTANLDFVVAFTEDLKSALRAKGYNVSTNDEAPAAHALIVQCTIMEYAPGSALKQSFDILSTAFWYVALNPDTGNARAGVRTLVLDKKTGQALAHMVTIRQVDPWFKGDILQHVASDIAAAIDSGINENRGANQQP